MAGTLVHTTEGLKPIEEISVGDSVLSKSESGQGGLSYQSVVRTVSFDEKPVWLVTCLVENPKFPKGGKIEHFVVTPNHSFWVQDQGWTPSDRLYNTAIIQLNDGDGYVLSSCRLFRTTEENVAAAVGVFSGSGVGSETTKIVFNDAGFEVINFGFENEFYFPFGDGEGAGFCRKVYAFEVYNTHTYYVGEVGAWAHNTNCAEYGVHFSEARNGMLPSQYTRVYTISVSK